MRKTAIRDRTHVRVSVPLPVEAWARLCGVAALRGVDRSALAAAFVLRGLKGSRVVDGSAPETEPPGNLD
jgi:hypothetical protein